MENELIAKFKLMPHPEGGYFREIFRSDNMITLPGSEEQRSAVTTILFLLEKGQISRFHRISPDEIWHFYSGAPLELYLYNEEKDTLASQILSSKELVRVVPGGIWQAARPLGEYTLTGCTVAPGFEFDDFHFMKDTDLILRIKSSYPDTADLI